MYDGEALARWTGNVEVPTTGHAGWDALLRALVHHEVELAGLVVPAWASFAPLDQPWQPPHPFMSAERVADATPPWLARWNVHVPARDLVTA